MSDNFLLNKGDILYLKHNGHIDMIEVDELKKNNENDLYSCSGICTEQKIRFSIDLNRDSIGKIAFKEYNEIR